MVRTHSFGECVHGALGVAYNAFIIIEVGEESYFSKDLSCGPRIQLATATWSVPHAGLKPQASQQGLTL